MKTITKWFETLAAAEQYQNQLYGRYDHVRLVRAPRFIESGMYTWEVGKKG